MNHPIRLLSLFLLLACALPAAQMFQPTGLQPNLVDNIERPLRYTPEGQDFVIENGGEFFNRPLYGGNTAFRVDAGDMPEFALYLPGRGGNLRFGVRTASGAKWVHEAERIVARYRPGEMLYEISDPLLGQGVTLRLHAIALHQTDGLIVRVEATGTLAKDVELIAAYGGANGKRGKRDGDIGTEAIPIGQYFQLSADACKGNTYSLEGARFTLSAPSAKATLVGQFPVSARLAVCDAAAWNKAPTVTNLGAALASDSPIVVSSISLASASPSSPLFFSIQRVQEKGASATADELADYRNVTTADRPDAKAVPTAIPLAPAYSVGDLSRVFSDAEKHFSAIRNQIAVETPDPFINAAVAALNVGADAVWDEPQGAVMHGAIAWRSKLLGWRGPYAMDALGWHEKARRHLSYWATRQNTDPVPAKLPPADEDANLSRSEAALHSNGDMANSHYDMNTVYIDALFRHFLWTGDLGFARDMWPVIERHLAWERRLFRREYGPEKLPIYESYAQIWASDDLQYHGGGTAYASAYAYYHNAQAARLARVLGKDAEAANYEREAMLIARGMREYLWLPEEGMFAEFRDYLGLKRAHASAGLWSFYHVMDASGLVTTDEAHTMVRYVNTHYPALPVKGPGVPADEQYQVLSTTDWMPYTWSVNNVVMGENIHAALGLWQAGRPDYAFRLTKSALLASMFMGICPGNVGSLNYLDVYRRESQRDFADGSGVTSRAIVEGLFGVRPDALAGELTICPGLPSQWDRASLRHPDVTIGCTREGLVEKYVIDQRFAKPMALRLQVLLRGNIPSVTINGQKVSAPRAIVQMTSLRYEIVAPAAERSEIVITWGKSDARVDNFHAYPPWSYATEEVPDAAFHLYSSANWSSAWRINPDYRPEGDSLILAERTKGPVVIRGDLSRPRRAEYFNWNASLGYDAKLDPVRLIPHFNDRVTQIFKNEYRSPRSPFVSLALPKQGIGAWAGHVNATADIDDSGLRAAARGRADRIMMPNGVPFVTPGDADEKNILFTSLWDNYPASATIPLEGRARRAYFLMAGTTSWMQSRIDNGEIVVTYSDGSTARLALRNPDTWWPIEQDLFYDDYQFKCDTQPPPRVNLKTGEIRILDADTFKGQGRTVPGGAATVLTLPLDPSKQLRSMTLRTLSNEVVIGLMSATLER